MGIGEVICSAKVGGYVIFGGDTQSLVAINICKRRLCEGTIKVAFERTFSLEVCHGVDQKVFLCLAGDYTNYTLGVSDFLDVTEIYKKQSIQENQYAPEKNKMLCLHGVEDETVDYDVLKIGDLDPDVRTEKTKSTKERDRENL